MEARGIRLQLTAPYSPAQNGVAERMNRTLVELSRAMLAAYKLPEFLWEPAVAHAAYVRNMSYTRVLPRATPYQVWFGRKPNASNLREFGAPVWVLLQGQNIQRKMLPKSQRRLYVGYDEDSHSVKYYNAATRNILLSRNYRLLSPTDPSPPADIAIPPPITPLDGPPHEGEPGASSMRSTATRDHAEGSGLGKRKADTDIDLRDQRRLRVDPDSIEPRKTRGIRVDYRYLNDPFTDEEEAGITIVQEKAFTVIPKDDCHCLRDAPHLRSGQSGKLQSMTNLTSYDAWEHGNSSTNLWAPFL